MISTLHLPYVANEGQVGGVGGQEDIARQLFDLASTDPEQGRKPCLWNDKLAQVAYQRCYSMAWNGWADHVDPSGVGPDQYVVNAGFTLPDNFMKERNANNCESLAFGGAMTRTAADMWGSWMNSPSHKKHVLGMDDYFASQHQVGIAAYWLTGSKWGWYISFLSWPD